MLHSPIKYNEALWGYISFKLPFIVRNAFSRGKINSSGIAILTLIAAVIAILTTVDQESTYFALKVFPLLSGGFLEMLITNLFSCTYA